MSKPVRVYTLEEVQALPDQNPVSVAVKTVIEHYMDGTKTAADALMYLDQECDLTDKDLVWAAFWLGMEIYQQDQEVTLI